MRYNFTALLLLITTIAFAQITITSGDMPGANDTLRYSTADLDLTTLAIYQNAGANTTWDFSHLEPTAQEVDEYKASFQTPYAFFFLGFDKYGLKVIDTIDLGGVTITNVYDFYKNSNTKFEAEGRGMSIGGIPIPSWYDDNDEIYQFPLQYNDRDSSTFDYAMTIPTIGSLKTAGYRINTVDGWGQITTPYGTFDCIRVVTDIISVDSIDILGFTLGGPNVRKEYKWLAKGERFPILEITGTEILGVFAPTSIRYKDKYRNVPSRFAPISDFTADILTPEAFVDTVTFTPEVEFAFPGTSYKWNITPSTYSYTNGTDSTSENPQILFYGLGTYDITLRVQNNFGADDSTKIAYINVEMIDVEKVKADMKIFPNPVTMNWFNLKYNLTETSNVRVDLFDAAGKHINALIDETQLAGSYQPQYSTGQLANGVYFLRVNINDEKTLYKLVISN